MERTQLMEDLHMGDKPSVAIVGAGAIGSTIAGWLYPHYDNLHLLARGQSALAIREKGLKLYLKGERANAVPMPIKVIESLKEIPPPEIVVIAVKNYDLDRTQTK